MALAIYMRGRKKSQKNEKKDWKKIQSKNTSQKTKHKQNHQLVCFKCLNLLYSILIHIHIHIFMTMRSFVKNKVIIIWVPKWKRRLLYWYLYDIDDNSFFGKYYHDYTVLVIVYGKFATKCLAYKLL